MNNAEQDFSPERIDQQIEYPTVLLSSTDRVLVEDLRRTYQSDAQKNNQSLQRVWQRLEASQQPSALSYATDVMPTPSAYAQKVSPSTPLPPSHMRRPGRTFGTIAAVIIMAVLVGSMVLIFSSLSKKDATTAGGHAKSTTTGATATHTTTSPSGTIYITFPTTWTSETLSKLDSQTHKTMWSYTIPGEMGTPIVDNNTVYISAMSGTQNDNPEVIALDTSTGKVRWNHPFASTIDANGDNLGYLTGPTITGNRAYVLNRAGILTTLDTATGKQLWTYSTGASALVDGTIYDAASPFVSNGILYGAQHNTLFALNATTGNVLWSLAPIPSGQIFNGVQIINGVIYTASYSISQHTSGMSLASSVYAFNANNGRQLWSYPTINWITTSPQLAGGNVYFIARNPFANQSTLYALNANGQELWHKDYQADLNNFVVDEGYLSISDGTYSNGNVTSYTLYLLNASTGTLVWQKSVVADPVQILQGVLYTSGDKRQIIAYDLKSGKELWRGQYGVDLVDKLGNHSASLHAITVTP